MLTKEVELQGATATTTYETHDPEEEKDLTKTMKEFDTLNKEEKAALILQAADITSDVARELTAQRENPNTPLSEDERASLERAHVLATYGDIPALVRSEPTDEPADDEPTDEPADDEPTDEPADDEPTDEPVDDEPTDEPDGGSRGTGATSANYIADSSG